MSMWSVRTLKQLFRIAQFCHKITPFYNPKYPGTFLHAVRLCNKEEFLPDEAFRLGLFKPAFSPDESSPASPVRDAARGTAYKYISRKKLTKVQEAANPASWAFLLKDKSVFYRYCMALGLPIPKLYAIFFRKTAGWSYNGSALTTRDDWKIFFSSWLPSEFVIKPTRGAYGQGLNIFTRSDRGFIDAFGKLYTARHLYDFMFSHPKADSFIIQQRLKNHPELIRLGGTQSLQTVRIITFVDSNGQCRILHAHLKPIIGRHIVDTFIDGLTGNVEAAISLDNGQLKPANQITSTGAGIEIIPIHPETGVSFDQFQLPSWPQTCRLVKEAAPKFLPVRAIGWDVALTPDGPCIVEANIWWDPPNQHHCIKTILDVLSCNSQSGRNAGKGDISA